MTHEEYLARLIRAFTGDPGEPRQPGYSGSSEADAVVRWLAYHVAMYAMETCRFVPSNAGWLVQVLNVRTWHRWGHSGNENVDLTLWGLESLRGNLATAGHSMKVRVNPGRSEGNYFLRLSDWRTSGRLDVDGRRVEQRNGRIQIEDRGTPLAWMARQPRRTARSNSVELQACCRTAMRDISRISGRFQTYTRAARVFQDYSDISSPMWDPTDFSSSSDRLLAPLSAIQRNRIGGIITLELSTHDSDGPLHTHWELMRRACHELQITQ
jgi:hypothetical protein